MKWRVTGTDKVVTFLQRIEFLVDRVDVYSMIQDMSSFQLAHK